MTPVRPREPSALGFSGLARAARERHLWTPDAAEREIGLQGVLKFADEGAVHNDRATHGEIDFNRWATAATH